MATGRGFAWGAAAIGAIAAFVLLAVIGAVIVFGGLYPVGASSPHSAGVRWLFTVSRDRAVERSASGLTPPKITQEIIREGGSHYKGMCQACHGGPGVKPGEFAAGMNPAPPDLAEAAGDLSVSQVFWIAKNGFKMTGMPSFGKTDEDEELWEVAAFVKQLPKVSAAEYAALPNAHEEEGREHEDSDGHSH